MVPATRASSTIDSRLSLSLTSSSVGIIPAIMHRSTPGASERLLLAKDFAKQGPGARLVVERPGVRRARRRQVNEPEPRRRLADQLAADGRSGRAVERDRP